MNSNCDRFTLLASLKNTLEGLRGDDLLAAVLSIENDVRPKRDREFQQFVNSLSSNLAESIKYGNPLFDECDIIAGALKEIDAMNKNIQAN